MIKDLPDGVTKKINETGLDSLKVVLQSIKSELDGSQRETVVNHLVDMVECQNGIYHFFCNGPNPTKVELLRIELATMFMYHPEIAEKYVKNHQSDTGGMC